MPTQITGTTGVSKVQDGAVVTADLAALAVTPEKMSQKMTLMTGVTATGTAVDFTGIPSWVNRISVTLFGVSVSGTSGLLTRLGTSGGIVSSGYESNSTRTTGTGVNNSTSTTGLLCSGQSLAADTYMGRIVLERHSGDKWIFESKLYEVGYGAHRSEGGIELGDVLTRLRLTTVNGTDTFDAGTVNVLYEG